MMLQKTILKYKTIVHSIPIGSIVALLLLFTFLISPNIYYGKDNSKVYAVENNVISNSSNNNVVSTTNNNSNNSATYSSNSSNSSDDNSSTSLIIGGAEMNEVVDASVGEVAYRKHTVTISASKLKSYTLFISGPEGLDGESTITGANGNTPVDTPNNSWGYAYGQDGNENSMTYSSFTNNAELIDSKLESESTEDDTDFTKNLVFAVKFGNAIAGHYTGTVTLSLAAEPKEVVLPTNPVETWEELQSMQQMTSKACASIGTAGSGTYPSKTLVDSRDGNEYTITKLDDQNCWMTTNLKLDISKANSLTPENSNVSSNWPSEALPSSIIDSSTITQNNNIIPHWNNGTVTVSNGSYDSSYGYYYNYCAATAGQGRGCKGAIAADISSKYSICPKGWELPTAGEYGSLLNSAGIINNNAGSTKIRSTPYNFLYAGRVANGYLNQNNSSGYYWSSSDFDGDQAKHLFFSVIYVRTNDEYRANGLSVRCIAQ